MPTRLLMPSTQRQRLRMPSFCVVDLCFSETDSSWKITVLPIIIPQSIRTCWFVPARDPRGLTVPLVVELPTQRVAPPSPGRQEEEEDGLLPVVVVVVRGRMAPPQRVLLD